MKKLIAILLTLAMVLSLAACANEGTNTNEGETENTENKFKVGFIHVSDPSDMGYTYNHDLGVQEMKKELGLSDDQVISKYNIHEDDSCATAIEELVAAGCNMIFATSFGHGDYMTEAAARYPDIEFCHATGAQAASSGLSNYHNYFTSIYQARYLAGVVAGLKLNQLIEEGTITEEEAVIGYVAAFYYEEIISGFTAFYLGAKSVCPSATMITLKVDNWSDPAKEAQLAQTLIDDGAVIISQHSDNTTPATTAEANGVFQCGYNSDMIPAAPKASLISARANWAAYYTYAVKCGMEGKTFETDWCHGFDTGANYLSPLNEEIAAPGTAEILDDLSAKMATGEIKAFAGPWHGYNIWSNEEYTCNEGEWFEESVTQSAPYFGYIIDGITLLDK